MSRAVGWSCDLHISRTYVFYYGRTEVQEDCLKAWDRKRYVEGIRTTCVPFSSYPAWHENADDAKVPANKSLSNPKQTA